MPIRINMIIGRAVTAPRIKYKNEQQTSDNWSTKEWPLMSLQLPYEKKFKNNNSIKKAENN